MPYTAYSDRISEPLHDFVARKGGERPASTDWDAAGDGIRLADAAISSGDATLASASAVFTDEDIGKTVCIFGAGFGGDALWTTISSRNSTTSVEIAINASVTVVGAVCYYGTNDFTALQAALTNALAGSAVRLGLLGRIYLCSTGLTIDRKLDVVIEGAEVIIGDSATGVSIEASDVYLRGYGPGAIRTAMLDANTITVANSIERVKISGLGIAAGGKTIDEPNRELGNCVFAHGDGGAVSDVSVSDCTLSGGHNGILLEFADYCRVSGCRFRWTHEALACVSLRSSDHCSITDNSFTDSGETANAIYLLHAADDPSKYNTITGNRISGSFSFEAINVFGAYNTVNNNTIRLTKASGYSVGVSFAQPGDADTASQTHDNIASGNAITLSTSGAYPGINCIDNGSAGDYGSNDNIIVNNQLQGCGIVINDHCLRNKISGNNIDAENKSSLDCISLQGSAVQGSSVCDNTLRDAGRKGIYNNGPIDSTIRGNTITGAAEEAITTGGDSDRIAIVDNHIYGNHFGIYFPADPVDPRVYGNKVYDNPAGDYSLGTLTAADTRDRDQTGKLLIGKVLEQDTNLKLDLSGSDMGIDNNKGFRMRKASGALGDATFYRDTGDKVVVRNAETGGGMSLRTGGDTDRLRIPGPAGGSEATNPFEFLLPAKFLYRLLFNDTNISINPITGSDYLEFRANSDGTGTVLLRLYRNTAQVEISGALLVEGDSEIRGGTGSPNGVVGSPLGSLYLSADGKLYVKSVDTGTTGWEQLNLPSQATHGGKFLQTDGSSASWQKFKPTDANQIDVTGLTASKLTWKAAAGTALESLATSGTGFFYISSGVPQAAASKVTLDDQNHVTHSLNQGNVCVIGSFGTLTEITDANLAAQIGSEMATELLANSGFMASVLAHVKANITITLSDDGAHGHDFTAPDTVVAVGDHTHTATVS